MPRCSPLTAQNPHQSPGQRPPNWHQQCEPEHLLVKRHRASSAIEGFNAALRPHLYVHKGASQGFLNLFRAYYNLRNRRWGRHKGTSAHQCLTGERVDDWLTTLGYGRTRAAA